MPKQTTDISGNPIAISYTAVGETWTIAKDVEVFGNSAGIFSAFASSRLVNDGEINGGRIGVQWDMAGATGTYSLVNKANGAIGGEAGFYLKNFLGSLHIQNDGEISGIIYGVVTALGSGDVRVDNTGEIYSPQFALFIGATFGAIGPVVNNYGEIDGGSYGVYISGPEGGGVAKLINHDGAEIDGTAAVYSGMKLDLKNEGKISGNIIASSYDDRIINKKTVAGDVQLDSGIDTFKSKGKAKSGLIDTGDGNDLVVLGDKADKLLFDAALSAATNVDTIRKFVSGKDVIYLDEDIFSAITPGTLSTAAFHQGTSSADADDRIIYDKASGALYYDPDGLGGVAQTQFVRLDGGPKLKASDFTKGEYSIDI